MGFGQAIQTASNLKPHQAGEHIGQTLGSAAFRLPHSPEVEAQYLEGNLLAELSMKDSKDFRKEIDRMIAEVFGC